MAIWVDLLIVVTLASASAEEGWPLVLRGIFTPEECDRISTLFVSMLPAENDVREGEGVSRINRWDAGGVLMAQGSFDWIHSRLVESLDLGLSSAEAEPLHSFQAQVEFNLMHEFTAGRFFEWHVDAKPDDGKYRTFNVNVMLSRPGVDFGGGALQVGQTRVDSQQGDVYVYPASFPHAVEDVTAGVRRTLVVALAEPDTAGGGPDLQKRRATYWRASEGNLAALAAGPLGGETKIHLLHAQLLEALGRSAEAERAYCRSYRATAEAARYARHFSQEGVAALEQGAGDERLRLAHSYFTMAACIDPYDEEAAEAARTVAAAIAQAARPELREL